LVSLQTSAGQLEDPQKKLLDLWFSCSPSERRRQFADTVVAAEIVGVSQRTIRFWIESGCIQAVRIAEKYHIHKKSLESFVLKQALRDQ
jgi:excisionase family DNA binding protein